MVESDVENLFDENCLSFIFFDIERYENLNWFLLQFSSKNLIDLYPRVENFPTEQKYEGSS